MQELSKLKMNGFDNYHFLACYIFLMVYDTNVVQINKRDRTIDLIKGVAIFLVLWGHCIQYGYAGLSDFFENSIFKIIYSFHMPLFMLVSGYLLYTSSLKYKDFSSCLNKKIHSLAKAIVLGSIIYFVLVDVLFEIVGGGGIILLFSGQWIHKLDGLWFLWAVLSSSVVMIINKYYGTTIFKQIVIVVLGVFIVSFFPNWGMNVWMYPYFVIGYYYAKNKDKFKRFINLKYVSIVAFPLMLYCFEKKHYFYTSGLYGNSYSLVEYIEIDMFRWMIGLVGCIFVIILIEELTKIRFLHPVGNVLAKTGQQSLWIYVLQRVLLELWLSKALSIVTSEYEGIYIDFISNSVAFNIAMFVLAVIYAFVIYHIIKLAIKLSMIIKKRLAINNHD